MPIPKPVLLPESLNMNTTFAAVAAIYHLKALLESHDYRRQHGRIIGDDNHDPWTRSRSHPIPDGVAPCDTALRRLFYQGDTVADDAAPVVEAGYTDRQKPRTTRPLVKG